MRLPPQQGGPDKYELRLSEPDDPSVGVVTLDDVVFGDVWVCGGRELLLTQHMAMS